jgi:ABC-2 type transport system permease protein
MQTPNLTKISLVAFWTILSKEITRILRIWTQSLLPSAISMSLYLLIFGHLIGNRIAHMDGVPYNIFITPGLIMMAVINGAYANVSSSFYLARFQHSLDEILVSPTPNSVFLAGFVGGGIVRGFLLAIIIGLIAIPTSHTHVQHWGLMLVMVLLTACAFSIAGFINGVYAKKFDDIAFIPTFILTPLTYSGCVFYSFSSLPHFGKIITYCNPIFYFVNAFRFSVLGFSDVNVIYTVIAALLINVALFYTALFLLNRGSGIRT